MTILHRYLLKQIVFVATFASVLLMLILWLPFSLRFFKYIFKLGISFSDFITLVGFLLPEILSLSLPLVVFASLLFCYHRLIQDRELIICRATGIDLRSLIRPGLWVAMVCVILGWVIGHYWEPMSKQQIKNLTAAHKQSFHFVVPEEGTFRELGNKYVLYVHAVTKPTEFQGLMLYDGSSAEHPILYLAERAELIEQEHLPPKLVLHQGSRREYNSQDHQWSVLNFSQNVVDLGLLDKKLEISLPKIERRTSLDLIKNFGNLTSVDQKKAMIAVTSRTLGPLFTIGLALLALSWVIRIPFNRRGNAWHYVALIVIAAAIKALDLGIQSAWEKEWLQIIVRAAMLMMILSVSALFLLNRKQNIPTNAKP